MGRDSWLLMGLEELQIQEYALYLTLVGLPALCWHSLGIGEVKAPLLFRTRFLQSPSMLQVEGSVAHLPLGTFCFEA